MGACNRGDEGMAMRIRIGKRAIFFTIIAISLAAVIMLAFVIGAEYRLRNKMFVIETRVDTLNSFVHDIEKDLERGLSISSFRSLLSVIEYTIENGTYSEDLQEDFKDALINSSVRGVYMPTMENSSFTDWTDKIKIQAAKLDILTNLSVSSVYIYQDNPWTTKVNILLEMNITDKRNTAQWKKQKNITTEISIEGFEDPVYAINSLGRVVNTVDKSPYSSFSNEANYRHHINESYYINSTTGPSFLMRLEGNLGNSTAGIESIVNLQKFIDQGLTIYTKSGVDYIYFGNGSMSSCQINETAVQMPWHRLDTTHLSVYDAMCV